MYVSLRRSENSPRMMGAKDEVGGKYTYQGDGNAGHQDM